MLTEYIVGGGYEYSGPTECEDGYVLRKQPRFRLTQKIYIDFYVVNNTKVSSLTPRDPLTTNPEHFR
jgi:hypothetical protein